MEVACFEFLSFSILEVMLLNFNHIFPWITKLSIFIRFQEAEDDCTEALNLDDRYIKAYSRRSTARKELRKLKESVEGRFICGYVNSYLRCICI